MEGAVEDLDLDLDLEEAEGGEMEYLVVIRVYEGLVQRGGIGWTKDTYGCRASLDEECGLCEP